MKTTKQKLLIELTDRKLNSFKTLEAVPVPVNGWINTIRTSLGMSLRQLGERLEISPQSVKEIEERETSGSITLNNLREAASALKMKLVYGFVPMELSLERMIEQRAKELAETIVKRTTASMTLEDQKNSDIRIANAITEQAEELKREMPKYLWD